MLVERNGYRIRVSEVFPPIPTTKFDYCAVDDDTYDGAEGCNCPIGYGATAEEAIADLLTEIDEAS